MIIALKHIKIAYKKVQSNFYGYLTTMLRLFFELPGKACLKPNRIK